MAYQKTQKLWSFRSCVPEHETRPCCFEPKDSEKAPLPACRVLLYLIPRFLETQKAISRQSRSALSLQSRRGVHVSLWKDLVGKVEWRGNCVMER